MQNSSFYTSQKLKFFYEKKKKLNTLAQQNP